MTDAANRFVVLQRSLEVPGVEKLKRAFHSVKCLTESDAHTLAKDAFGILVKNLTVEDAMALQAALGAEDIDTAVVLQSDLPQLPPIKFVRQLDCLTEGLVVHDAIGRQFSVRWDQIMLVAAGSVLLTVFEQEKVTPTPSLLQAEVTSWSPFLPRRGVVNDPAPEYVSRERQASKLLLELLLSGAVMRFQVEAGRFRFDYLGDRKRPGLMENFALLARDVMKFAPQAMVNRGAYFVPEGSGPVFEYPSKNAFYEEITWMLWQAMNAKKT
ncbi:MAG TPA: hypothetical protein VN887_18600 [Candidatus Angelobacter sp.]|nr:hypothetical protein [Candidatus Angelobacter sp.]